MLPLSSYRHVWALIAALIAPLAMGQGMRFETLGRDEGLSQVTVNTIVQDERGFLWVGTQEGLNRYDGYEFRQYVNKPKNPNSISGNQISSLVLDDRGYLWIGTVGDGLSRLELDTERFKNYRRRPDDPNGPVSNRLSQIRLLENGTLAIVGPYGLNFFDPETEIWRTETAENSGLVTDYLSCMAPAEDGLWLGGDHGFYLRKHDGGYQFIDLNERLGGDFGRTRALYRDRTGLLWIGTESGGLVQYNIKTQQLKTLVHDPNRPDSLTPGQVHVIREDSRGNMWVGTTEGLNLFNAQRTAFSASFQRQSGQKYTLGDNEILTLFEDRTGILWVGTMAGGISKYNYRLDAFGTYRYQPSHPEGMSKDPVLAFCEDARGNLWIGHMNGGLVRMDPKRRNFIHYRHVPGNPNTLAADSVFSIAEDVDGRIWVATTGGLNRLNPKTGDFEFFGRDPQNPHSLSCPIVTTIYRDTDDILWMGTVTGGLNRFVRNKEHFFHLSHDNKDPHSLSDNFVWTVSEDHQGVLWVGTREGLNRLSKDRKHFDRYLNDPDNPNSLSHSEVLALLESKDRTLWLGTSKGLNRMNPDTQTFTNYTADDGLPSNSVLGILEDSRGLLWISTNNGLSRFDPDAKTFRTYYERDGLQGNEFSSGAQMVTRAGELVFGGVNGMNLFKPQDIVDDPVAPPIALTRMRLFNKPVAPRYADPDSPLTKPIESLPDITLDYQDDVVAFEFAALHFAAPEANRYAYKMEGSDHRWIETDAAMRFATYTKLDAGTYHFKVKAANKDGVWTEQTTGLKVVMKPAPWASPLAYLLYTLTVLAALFALVRYQQRKLERERAVNDRLIQVDKLKDQFLANTSHELRTPLNGMIGLAESLRDGIAGELPAKAQANLDMIINSGRRLGGLVDDILDYSKLKDGAPNLALEPVDLHLAVENVLTLTAPLCSAKPVVQRNHVPTDLAPVLADEQRLQQILLNLVGNAVKFTKEGEVVVKVDAEDNGRVRVHVNDTGIGIPESQLERIFQSFQQGDASTERAFGGTGLGLTVASELVGLHGCRLVVNSQVGVGSDFSFTLPLKHGATPVNTGAVRTKVRELDEEALEETLSGARLLNTDAEFHILIVDDEVVNRRVVMDHLSLNGFHLVQVEDGPAALAALERETPFDLVLLDIMMPGMSGYEVCRKIREVRTVGELPIIFMTARGQMADLVEGFKAGANDFLTKPIRKPELLARVRTHLELLELARALEKRVASRTAELRDKNAELNSRYKELETLEDIVRIINAEVEYDHLIRAMLEQGVVLFPEAERAAFLSVDTENDRFYIAGAVGYNMEPLKGVSFSRGEIVEQYAGRMFRFQSGVYITDKFEEVVSAARLVQTEDARSMAAVSITFDDQVVGVLILLSHDPGKSFRDAHLDKLVRFREHVVSAVGKALVLKDLVGTQKRFQDAAHEAGMAEIVANVLHNVGNILNSAQVSAHLLNETLDDSKGLELFGKTCRLITDNAEDLGPFFANDPRGRQIPEALQRIQNRLSEQSETLKREGRNLEGYVRDMTAALKEQQEHAQIRRLSANTDINRLIREVLHLESYLFKKENVDLKVSLERTPIVKLEPSRFMHILVYLLKNALEALGEVEREQHRITISASTAEGGARIVVQDNGPGIANDQMSRIYAYGYTTKPDHRGFGLHYCANAVKEMNGSIEITSGGAQPGARVTLWFPATEDDLDGVLPEG